MIEIYIYTKFNLLFYSNPNNYAVRRKKEQGERSEPRIVRKRSVWRTETERSLAVVRVVVSDIKFIGPSNDGNLEE